MSWRPATSAFLTCALAALAAALAATMAATMGGCGGDDEPVVLAGPAAKPESGYASDGTWRGPPIPKRKRPSFLIVVAREGALPGATWDPAVGSRAAGRGRAMTSGCPAHWAPLPQGLKC